MGDQLEREAELSLETLTNILDAKVKKIRICV